MKENILVSVIIPVYQTEKYLWRCVESVRKQSYKNLEILLIDDGSTDKSPAICDNLSLLDERIKVVHQANGGISSARNTGLKNAKGKYITFLDSDDFLHEHFIKYLLSLCIRHKAQMAACKLYTGSGSDFKGVSMKGKVLVFDKKEAILSRKMKSGVVGKLYKRKLLKDLYFPVSDHFNYEDEALSYKFLYRSDKIALSARPLYYYYKNTESTTRKENHYKPTDFYEVLRERIRFFADKDKELLEYSWEYLCLNLMLFYISCKKDKKNTNDTGKLLKLYEEAYFKMLYSKVTPLRYKFMFTCFYLAPELCAAFANKVRD
ncbi:glycosyltransferase family 2 protein [Anaerocolumna xylanovorans]|uniref:Glycosyltransferase involved in cell wall bisynthesis n=1 Tax=Anaerocolumna xylanovorans DSM 12503 TaxID=1121345 RepID=A0A1M7Y1X4_9FIRM|nr:glycosyltransferase family 2 protein [Anaerocolumna xylanovorans]SHO45688.1 Glycosyltransferase involved in cell wall bisynthesis [Anaerocolumna xylanovorans DSM 12503]